MHLTAVLLVLAIVQSAAQPTTKPTAQTTTLPAKDKAAEWSLRKAVGDFFSRQFSWTRGWVASAAAAISVYRKSLKNGSDSQKEEAILLGKLQEICRQESNSYVAPRSTVDCNTIGSLLASRDPKKGKAAGRR